MTSMFKKKLNLAWDLIQSEAKYKSYGKVQSSIISVNNFDSEILPKIVR